MQLHIAETSAYGLFWCRFIKSETYFTLNGKNLSTYSNFIRLGMRLMCNNLLLLCSCQNHWDDLRDASNERIKKVSPTKRRKVRYDREKARGPNSSREREGWSVASCTNIEVVWPSTQPHKPACIMIHIFMLKLIGSYYIFKCAWQPCLCVLIK